MINQNFKKIFLFWGPVVLWCGVIFTLSSLPTLPEVGFVWWDFVMKKSAHIIEYAILYFLLWRAITETKCSFPPGGVASPGGNIRKICKKNNSAWILPLIVGLIYAISDEYHQSFVIGRTAMARDVGFDFLGMLIVLYWLKKKTKL